MDICGKDALWIPEGNCECGEGGGPAITKVLYSQLVALQQASMLEPGMQYRIIDYECTTTQEGTDVIPHPFDIIVVADDENTLNENARAMVRDSDVYYTSNHANLEAWELKYTVDNDQDRFHWADPVNGKGVVFYMKDDYDNEAHYDFKQIVFERYEILSSADIASLEHHFISKDAADYTGPTPPGPGPMVMSVKPGALKESPKEIKAAIKSQQAGDFTLSDFPTYAYTFSAYINGEVYDTSVTQDIRCADNSIGTEPVEDTKAIWLTDNVFINSTTSFFEDLFISNKIGLFSKSNTFGNNSSENVIESGCQYITTANGFRNNHIEADVSGVYVGGLCNNNTIGANSEYIRIDYDSNENVIGMWANHLFLGSNNHGNVFGVGCSEITLGYSCHYNIFDALDYDIRMEQFGSMNSFGTNCSSIYMYLNSHGNMFGNGCSDINLSTSRAEHNSFGTGCAEISIEGNVDNCTFEDNVLFVSLVGTIFNVTFETGVKYIATTDPDGIVYGYYFLTNTTGPSQNNPYVLTATPHDGTLYVGQMSDGTFRIWNPADVSGSNGPVVVTAAADMTDTSQIYIYEGSEAGYVNGNWYYYNGVSWVSGGTYGTNINIDPSLSHSGQAADAKATGDAIAAVQADIETVLGDIANVESGNTATQNYPVGDYVIVNHQLYQVTVAIPTSGTITPGTNVVSISVGEVLKDLEERIDAAFVTDKASGTIAHFEDGADDIPVKDLKIGIEPVQDLHGYTNPWPAGGGKNLLPITVANIKAINTVGTWNGNTYTLYGVTYTLNTDNGGNIIAITVNGTASAYSLLRLVNAWTNSEQTYLSGAPSTSSGNGWRIQAEGDSTMQDLGHGIPLPSGYSATRIIIVVPSGANPNNAVFNPMIRLLSVSDSTFEPYSNIAPITGWTEANVTRAGKNITKFTWGTQVPSIVNGEMVAATGFATDFVKVDPSLDYVISAQTTSGHYVLFYDKNKQYLGKLQGYDLNGTLLRSFASWNATAYIKSRLDGSNTDPFVSQLEIGSTATTYEPYSGNTYNISFGSAGTVYVGTLDVDSGVLTVSWKLRTFNELNSTYNIGTNGDYFYVTPTDKKVGNINLRSSAFAVRDVMSVSNLNNGEMKGHGSTRTIYWKDTQYSTVSDFLTGMGTQTILYAMDTPQTYQLTPTEVKTILGANNIWADTGDTEVEYRADTKLYIEQLTKPTEDDMKANTAIQSGKFFMVGNRLFLSTAAIASGDTINPGTNCTELSLADALNNLN